MAEKIVRLPGPADPTIEEVLGEFLAEQRSRLKPRTLSNYEFALGLLRDYLDGYAYESLSEAESALFERCYGAAGEEHREFCQVFGPDKIIENLGSFLGYFMVRKVIAGADMKRTAGTATKKLSKWLAAKGYVAQQDAEAGAQKGAEAARDLPSAERAAQILHDAAVELAVDPQDYHDEDCVEFDHFTISKVEPGKLWLESWLTAESRPYGPIPAPESATRLLREGWDISCSLARVRGAWRIVEVGNAYPS